MMLKKEHVVLKKSLNFKGEEVYLKNFLELTNEEAIKILEFRNHPLVKKQMLNSDDIPLYNHLQFLTNLKNKNVGYWVLCSKKSILGVVNLTEYDDNTNSFLGGNYSNPSLIGSGVGFLLNYYMHLVAFENLDSDKLRAIVRKENKDALRLNKVFGGILIGTTIIEEKDYIQLVFNRDNWHNNIKNNTSKLLKHVQY